MRLLILNDDTHGDRFCFEDGERYDLEGFLEVACASHDDWPFRRAFLPDIYDYFQTIHPDFNESDVTQCVENMFDNLMWHPNITIGVYKLAFDDMWNCAGEAYL